jgi:hypothetical protein
MQAEPECSSSIPVLRLVRSGRPQPASALDRKRRPEVAGVLGKREAARAPGRARSCPLDARKLVGVPAPAPLAGSPHRQHGRAVPIPSIMVGRHGLTHPEMPGLPGRATSPPTGPGQGPGTTRHRPAPAHLSVGWIEAQAPQSVDITAGIDPSGCSSWTATPIPSYWRSSSTSSIRPSPFRSAMVDTRWE